MRTWRHGLWATHAAEWTEFRSYGLRATHADFRQNTQEAVLSYLCTPPPPGLILEGAAANEEKATEEQKTEKVEEVSHEWEQLNKPLWMRKPEDFTNADYASFYKNLISVKHFTVEGQFEFKALLVLTPFDLFEAPKERNNIILYVRRVFTMDDFDELMPEWLHFFKGVVESEDLPLNISRGTLHQNKILRVIKKNLVKKCSEMFAELATKKDDYKYFNEKFGKYLKLLQKDATNRTQAAELMRHHTSNAGEEHSEFVGSPIELPVAKSNEMKMTDPEEEMAVANDKEQHSDEPKIAEVGAVAAANAAETVAKVVISALLKNIAHSSILELESYCKNENGTVQPDIGTIF